MERMFIRRRMLFVCFYAVAPLLVIKAGRSMAARRRAVRNSNSTSRSARWE
jgi:hypothetical protein